MSDEIVVSTRKGLFRVVRNAGRWDIDGVAFLGDNVSLALRIRAAAFVTPRSIMAISASSCIARRATSGRKSPRRPIRKSRKDSTKRICGAVPFRGARSASGRSRRAARTSRACFGAARCPAGCFVPTITAIAGQSSVRSGRIPSARNGWAAAPIGRAFIRSLSIRANSTARVDRRFDRRHLVHGRREAKAGVSAARACAPNMCRPNSRMIRSRRTFIASCNAPAAPEPHVGRSITTAFSSRRMRVGRLAKLPA